MIVNNQNIKNETIGDLEENKATIAKENLDMVIEFISSRLYNNRIGAFIREITSNCSDANKESGTDKPIIIKLYSDDGEDWFLSFRDYGLGMSDKKFNKIFMSVFESDKRKNNKQKGGWGVGSKSPMSYTNSFNIETTNSNIKNEYLYYKEAGEQKAMHLGTEENVKQNGTLITVPVKEKDLDRISEEINNQLAYFKDVIVFNDYSYHNNAYIIYKGKYFLYREDKQASYMHLSADEVSYPIDFDIVSGIPKYYREMPIALKFNTGELSVPLSREYIEYDKDPSLIEKIVEKAKLAIEELKVISLTKDEKETEDFTDIFKNYIPDRHKAVRLDEDVSIPRTSRLVNSLSVRLKGITLENSINIYKKTNEFIAILDVKRLDNVKMFNIATSDFIVAIKENKVFKTETYLSTYDKTYHKGINHYSYSANYKFHISKKTITLKNCLTLLGYTPNYKKYRFSSYQDTYYYNLDFITKKEFFQNHESAVLTKSLIKQAKFLKKYIITWLDSLESSKAPDDYVQNLKEEAKELEELRKETLSFYSKESGVFIRDGGYITYTELYGSVTHRSSVTLTQILNNDKIYYYLEKDKDKEYEDVFNYISSILYNVNQHISKKFKVIVLSKTTIKKYKKVKQIQPFTNIFSRSDLTKYFIEQYVIYKYSKKIDDFAKCYKDKENTYGNHMMQPELKFYGCLFHSLNCSKNLELHLHSFSIVSIFEKYYIGCLNRNKIYTKTIIHNYNNLIELIKEARILDFIELYQLKNSNKKLYYRTIKKFKIGKFVNYKNIKKC